jgi:hypothetical protein
MFNTDQHSHEYKVVVWDEDEVSTATFFRGPLAFDRASLHFHSAQDYPASCEAWFLRKKGKG